MKTEILMHTALAAAVALFCTASLAQVRLPGTGSAAMIKARTHFFGADHVNQTTGAVDPDKVIASWFGNSSFAVSFGGHVVLLDTYIVHLDRPGYVPTDPDELTALRPELIFVGHHHGDHADNAAYIAYKSGAKIVGSAEACVAMRTDTTKIFGAGALSSCYSVTATGTNPGQEVNALNVLEPFACVTAFKHVHSAGTVNDPPDEFPAMPLNYTGDDARQGGLYPSGTVAWNVSLLKTSQSPSPTTAIGYQFVLHDDPHFTLTWLDTAGPLKESAPWVFDLMSALPKTDLQLSSVASAHAEAWGMVEPARYIKSLQPKIFANAHEAVLPNFPDSATGGRLNIGQYYPPNFAKVFDAMAIPNSQRPQLRWLNDPTDYLDPSRFTFDYRNEAWRSSSRNSGTCGWPAGYSYYGPSSVFVPAASN